MFSYSQPRDKYLAALAAAKAAEAEYLAAEAVCIEEQALYSRLQELQQRKQTFNNVQPQFNVPPYYSAVALQQFSPGIGGQDLPPFHFPFNDAQLLHHQWSGQRRPLFQQAAAPRLTSTDNPLLDNHLDFLQHSLESYVPHGHTRPSHCPARNVGEATPQPEYMRVAPSLTNVSIKSKYAKKPSSSRTAAAETNGYEKLLSLQSQLEARIMAEWQANNTVRQRDMGRFFQFMGAGPTQATQVEELKAQVSPQDTSKEESRGSGISNSATGETKSDEEHILRIVYGIPPPPYLQEKKPTKVKPTCSTPVKSTSNTAPDAQTLKQQLEARLDNERANEIRDTIQAILVSICDTGASVAQQPATTDSNKGKAKLSDAPSTFEVQPTSKDVANSMETIRNIEAAFLALDSEFVFPAGLDFSASSPSSPSSDSESASVASHLAYTSRNHPVRFYEQALSALLSELDSVQSFGNETLRGRRKEVVSRIERALQVLEREVEGRLKVKAAKEAKAVSSELIPTSGVTTGASPEVVMEGALNMIEVDSSLASQPTEAGIVQSGVESDVTTHETPAKLEELAVPHETLSVLAPSTDSPVSVQGGGHSIQVGPENRVNPTADSHRIISQPIVTHQEEDLAVSEATIHPYDIMDRLDPLAVTEPFLLQSSHSEVISKKAVQGDQNGDTGSDWSEVEG